MVIHTDGLISACEHFRFMLTTARPKTVLPLKILYPSHVPADGSEVWGV